MATISGDLARCIIQPGDGSSFVLGLLDWKVTVPPADHVPDILPDLPGHYVQGQGPSTLTARVVAPPPEPEPKTDAERLARAVLAGDHQAAGAMADLILETWGGGKRHGAAILALERLQQKWLRQADEARMGWCSDDALAIDARREVLRLVIDHLQTAP